jgi:hypothetical protein
MNGGYVIYFTMKFSKSLKAGLNSIFSVFVFRNNAIDLWLPV